MTKDLDDVFPLRIDSPDVYNIIRNSDRIKIANIPCIIIFDDGRASTYEGEAAYDLVRYLVSNREPVQEVTPIDTVNSMVNMRQDLTSSAIRAGPPPQTDQPTVVLERNLTLAERVRAIEQERGHVDD
jgi:hypothetical protein